MQTSALAASPAVEGAFVSGPYNFWATMPASLRCGVGGVAMGRFAWADADGRVLNERGSADDMLGVVVPQGGDWRRIFLDEAANTWRIREGLPVTLAVKGKIWMRFTGGAMLGQPVYANVLDGAAIAGYSPIGELTSWTVAAPTAPGGLAIISQRNPP